MTKFYSFLTSMLQKGSLFVFVVCCSVTETPVSPELVIFYISVRSKPRVCMQKLVLKKIVCFTYINQKDILNYIFVFLSS